jgi:hypothetical protein
MPRKNFPWRVFFTYIIILPVLRANQSKYKPPQNPSFPQEFPPTLSLPEGLKKLVFSRHPGENRGPVSSLGIENTGFRPSPE